jgi:fatty acid desaturase
LVIHKKQQNPRVENPASQATTVIDGSALWPDSSQLCNVYDDALARGIRFGRSFWFASQVVPMTSASSQAGISMSGSGPSPAISADTRWSDKFSELERSIRNAGLLQRQPKYYFFRMVITLGLVALALMFIVVNAGNAFKWIGAVFLAVPLGQVGYMMHDLGHEQVFQKRRLNEIAGVLFGNILLGISTEWWRANHNRHHGHPNQEGLDPDISYPVFAFTEDQARSKTGLVRWIVRHQLYLLPAAMSLVPMCMRKDSFKMIFEGGSRAPLREILSLATYYLWFVGGAFWLLGFVAVPMLALTEFLAGMVMTTTFAPNHKGMPMLKKDDTQAFLPRQVLTSRNVTGGTLTDLWYGGLNYQIEHHLFPHMPCNNLRKAQAIVSAFCHEQGLPYVQTSAMESYREGLRHVREIGELVRTER